MWRSDPAWPCVSHPARARLDGGCGDGAERPGAVSGRDVADLTNPVPVNPGSADPYCDANAQNGAAVANGYDNGQDVNGHDINGYDINGYDINGGSAVTAADTDADGLTDAFEKLAGTDPKLTDTDADGLADNLEVTLGTNPASMDTDGDGLTDGSEIQFGLDPLTMEVGIELRRFPRPATTTAAVITAPVPAATTALPTGSTTGSTTDSTTGSTTAGGQVQDMLDLALKQVGDEYVFGADVAESDPDTSVWDCAELTQWSAAQAGSDIPGSSFEQYLDLKAKDLIIPVEQGMNTPGALLFHFSSEPQPGGGRPSAAHVASSLGNASMFGGQTLATTTAATAVPVTAPVTDAAPTIDPHRTAQRFVDAALDQRGDAYRLGAEADLSNADPGAFEIDPGVDIGDPESDSDHDGLTNQFETMIGTNPTAADSDLDGLLDGVEVSAGTDPMLMDTDLDGYTDGMELHLGLDPLDADAGDPADRPDVRRQASTCTEWRPP